MPAEPAVNFYETCSPNVVGMQQLQQSWGWICGMHLEWRREVKKVAAAYISRTISFIHSSLQNCFWLFIQVATNSCNPSHNQRFVPEKFFENEISENISQKFHDQWKI